VAAAYLLFVFLGWFGFHNFYLGRIFLGIIELILGILGWVLILAWGLGIVFLIPLAILLLIDLFIIPSGIKKNMESTRRELTLSMMRNKRATVAASE
jgi:TM2 domain-containing membrane protein YozV